MSFPTLAFWSRLLATLAVEVCVLAVLGFAAQRFVRPASWRRAVWQITVLCLLLLPLSEWTGLGRGAVDCLFGQKRVAERAPVSTLVTVKPNLAVLSVPPLIPRTEEAKPAVWWPGCLWLAGAGLVLARLAAAQLLLLVLRFRREKITTGPLRERIGFVSQRLGLRRKICPLSMPESMSPMAFGIFRPSIGLPLGFSVKFSATEQDAVLAHELAHLAAWDPLWFLLADLAGAALWWHPIVWWVRRSLHGAAELAADDATVLVPDGPGALAKCLVSLGREMTAARAWGWVEIRGGFRSNLGKRVERLMLLSGHARRPLTGWAIAAGVCIVPTMVLLFASLQSAPGQKADSLRDSWNNSPAAQLLLAALETNPVPADTVAINPASEKQMIDIATRVANAKLLYEMGKYDEAQTNLVQVMKDDPSNRSAPYFLDLIKEARYMDRARKREAIGREKILAKLQRIHLDEVSFDSPLPEVLNFLRTESMKRDPDGVGVNFMIEGHSALGDMSQVAIKISPPLKNIRLIDVLDAVTKMANPPISYSVEDYAVVFRSEQTLYSKVFKVNPNTFVQGLENVTAVILNPGTQTTSGSSGAGSSIGVAIPAVQVAPAAPDRTSLGLHYGSTNSTERLRQMVRNYFAAAGVDLTAPGKTVFFNDRTGLLLARATSHDFEIMQQALQPIYQKSPQVMVTAKFVEIDAVAAKSLSIDWVDEETNFSKILNPAQSKAVLAEFQRRDGGDILATPRLTTLSGRQCRMSSTNSTGEGVSLDVLPDIDQGGLSIQTFVSPSVKTDEGTWQFTDIRDIPDGHTLVLGGPLSGKQRKLVVTFVTPRIIDAAGNSVHSDEEISKAPKP